MLAFPDQILVVAKLLRKGEDCYLVGGAVRDMLYGREILDFDFVCDFDPRILARRLADHLGGAFYVMDEKRLTSRVISGRNSDTDTYYDFAQIQGNLLADQRARDFTINSMAVDLHDQEQVIDPLKGGRDLQENWLRPCTEFSFDSDPVRVIRAVRYVVDLKLKIEPGTRALLSNAVEKLDLVSIERKRDEFFKILENPKAHIALTLMEEFGIATKLGIPVSKDNLDQLRMYELLVNSLLQSGGKPQRDYFTAATFYSTMATFRASLQQIINNKNSSNHSRIQLGKFAAIRWDSPTSPIDENDLVTAFSHEEIKLLQTCSGHTDLLLELLNQDVCIDNRTAYRLFRLVGEYSIDLILLALAKLAGVPAAELDQGKWLSALSNAAKLLDLWLYHPETSRPQPFLDGTEIMQKFYLEGGPLIGQLLEELKEEQAAGEIKENKSALIWVKNRLNQIEGLR
jgi:tRNA nucleotidyltransferase/poly(A) polymerase